jgi:hypothetical protein
MVGARKVKRPRWGADNLKSMEGNNGIKDE